MTAKTKNVARCVEMILADQPFIHPGSLRELELEQWVGDLLRKMMSVRFDKSSSDSARDAVPIAQRKLEESLAALLKVGGPLLQESTPEVDLLKAPVAASGPEFPDQALTSPVDTARSPTPTEVETFQAMLSGALTEVHVDDLKATAIEIAIAVRSGFEEFYRPATSVCSSSTSSD